MRRFTAARVVLPLALAGALAGCGNDRVRPSPAPPPAPPEGNHLTDFPTEGVRFLRPDTWVETPGASPLVATVSSGRAVIAIWRYPRKGEQLPRTAAEFDRARRALVEAVKARDRQIKVGNVRFVNLSGGRGVEIIATTSISGRQRRVRSTHLFGHGAEYVIDAYAPARDFARVNRTVFQPLIGSIQIFRALRP